MAFPSGWGYRKAIPLTGSTDGAKTNFQRELVVQWISGKMRSDFGDVRFTKDDKTTEIPYDLASYTSEDEALFVLKLDSIPASPDTLTIYMYYGKSDATTTSSPEDVYDVYDDGSGTLTDAWTVHSGSWDKSDGQIRETSPSGLGAVYHTASNFGRNVKIEALITPPSEMRFGLIFMRTSSDFHYEAIMDNSGQWKLITNNDADNSASTKASATSSDPATSQKAYKVTIDNNGLIKLYYDGTEKVSYTESTEYTGQIGLRHWYQGTILFDEIRVSKYTTNDPTWGDWGSEESLIFNADLKTLIDVPWYESWLSGWESGSRSTLEYQSNESESKTDEIIEVVIPYVAGKMREDRGDIRFTKSDGITLLDYNLFDVSAEAPDYPATFHVRIPNVPASPGKFIVYAYTGNSSATDASNPEGVYNVFDDFEDGVLNTDLWQYNHGASEDGGDLILDYHSNNETGAEDYVASGAVIREGSKTVFRVQPETLEGPFRFGLYYTSAQPSVNRTTFSGAFLEYVGVILANEYIQTNFMPGDLHHTIEQFDVVDHTFEIYWKHATVDIYYDGELIKSYTNNLTASALYLLIRDRGYIDYVYSHNYFENPSTLISQGGWEKPSAYLKTLIYVPHHGNLQTLVEIYPVHDDLKTVITTRQETSDDLLTVIKALPPNVNLKTLIEVVGLYISDLKTLIRVTSPYLFSNNEDLDTKIKVNNPFSNSNSDLKTLILVGKTFQTKLELDWEVIRGGKNVEPAGTPRVVVEIGDTYYS